MDFDSFRDSERAGWSARAGDYDKATARATTQSIPMLLSAVRLYHGMRLLDAGCGPGYAAGAAAALGASVKGVDFSPDMVEAARSRFPGLAFEQADIEQLDEADCSFDAVVSNIVLFHVTDPVKAVSEAFRVLRPGGWFAFSQWSAPAQSELYRALLGIVMAEVDMSRAEAAPDAFLLSDDDQAQAIMREAGFTETRSIRVDALLRAPGDDFYAFFLRFGVRIPLILAKQSPAVQSSVREKVNGHFRRYLRDGEFHVPMPCVIHAAMRPG